MAQLDDGYYFMQLENFGGVYVHWAYVETLLKKLWQRNMFQAYKITAAGWDTVYLEVIKE